MPSCPEYLPRTQVERSERSEREQTQIGLFHVCREETLQGLREFILQHMLGDPEDIKLKDIKTASEVQEWFQRNICEPLGKGKALSSLR